MRSYNQAQSRKALFGAVCTKDILRCNTILNSGEDINKQDPINGYTALMIAVSKSNYIMVEYLLERGADINIKNHKQETAFNILEKISKIRGMSNEDNQIYSLLKQHI